MSADIKTTTAEALLGMLSIGPMSGYDLKQRIELSIGNFWTESYGQIYPALRKLEGDGLVVGEDKGKAGRKVYQLTEAGRDRLEEWLGVTPKPRVPRHETLLKLFMGANVPAETSLAHVAELRTRFAADLRRYEGTEAHLRRTYGGSAGLPYWLITLHYGRDEARMVVNWCDDTAKILEQLAKTEGRATVTRRKRKANEGSVSHVS